MTQQLRLAERRGFFRGPISPTAEFGLMILEMLDTNRANEAEVNAVKIGLLSHDPDRLETLFPQWFAPKIVEAGTPEAEAALASGDAVEDYSGVKWMSPQDMAGGMEDEIERLQQALLATTHVTVTQDDDGGWI